MMSRYPVVPISLALFVIMFMGCGSSADDARGNAPTSSPSTQQDVAAKQVNISLLLDLSDRVEPTKHPNSPEHFERDIEIAKSLVDYFKSDMRSKGAFQAEGKMRTIFSPPPSNSNINRIARQLEVDLSTMEPARKKVVFDSLATWYADGLSQIYDSVIESKDYVGADIWRFFKEGRVEDYCISSDPAYRNILVILTDGYMYHEASTKRDGNRTAYVTGPYLEREGFRDASNWRNKFESGDYGLLNTEQSFDELEVLVLEVNPSDEHPGDFDVIQAYWSKWFDEMGIDRYRIARTDLPVNTKKVITRFLKGES